MLPLDLRTPQASQRKKSTTGIAISVRLSRLARAFSF
jgi:hypothetical protein